MIDTQALRKRILDAAIRGKLTEQLSGELVDCSLPAKMVKTPFFIPSSWKWVKLGDVSIIARGGSPRPIKAYLTDAADGINWIKIGDAEKNGKYITSCKEKILRAGAKKSRMVFPGDFLLTNSMSFGRPYITQVEGCIHDGWLVISDYEKYFYQEFLYWILSSDYAFYQFCEVAAGAVVSNLNVEKVSNSLIPLPPLSEQKRIVAKIESVFSKLDLIDRTQKKLSDNSIALRSKLIELGIKGELTEQLAEDGNAEDLYKEIQAEKRRLIKEGKLKKEKSLSAIEAKDIPFEIPENWKWMRLGECGSWGAGATPARNDSRNYLNGTIPWLKTGDLNDSVINNVPEFITEYAFNTSSVRLNPVGSVLIAMYGATIGKLGILGIEATTNQACCACIPFSGVYNWFLYYVLLAYRGRFIEKGAGGAQPNISKEKIIMTEFPLPPLAEQKRIVEKLEKLLPLCDSMSKDIAEGDAV